MSIPLKLSFKGTFLEKLQARIDKLKGARTGAMIQVPPELEWWYWQEFGTASRGDAGGSSYEITPVTAKELAFPMGGEMQYRQRVEHPGVRPRRSVTKVLPEIQASTASKVREALAAGAADNPDELQAAILDAANEAKDLIVESLSTNVPGTRELDPSKGRLGGMTAAEVFEEQAAVVDITDEG